jgi:DNA-directed RNA polymerase subunit alpha
VLSSMGLALGMTVTGWPPENIEDLAKRLEEPF